MREDRGRQEVERRTNREAIESKWVHRWLRGREKGERARGMRCAGGQANGRPGEVASKQLTTHMDGGRDEHEHVLLI